MKEFTQSFGFVITFLIGTLVITLFLGEKVAFWYLLLILLGMIYTNVDEFEGLLGRGLS